MASPAVSAAELDGLTTVAEQGRALGSVDWFRWPKTPKIRRCVGRLSSDSGFNISRTGKSKVEEVGSLWHLNVSDTF